MYEYKCKIVKIVDGDTVDVNIDLGFNIWLSNKRIRLFNIDTPECRTTDSEEKKYGLLAKQFVIDTIPVGSTQTLITIDENDKYGRILGKIKLDNNTILNDLLIDNHLAVQYDGKSKNDIVKQHLYNRTLLNL